MHPTMFEIPYLPPWLGEIKSYGVMMMIAFLTGIWMACRRAYKSQANPDTILNMGFIALIFGVIGARAMFVIHYWDARFAVQPNPLLATLDIRAGGLEFWGGPLLAIPMLIVYLRYFAKASVRWYLDIAVPSLAWGLAVTRIGCFLNGCCWGAICVEPNDPGRQQASIPWAVRFPYGSPAMEQQYQFGQLTLPKELIWSMDNGLSRPMPRMYLEASVEDGGETAAGLKARSKELETQYLQRKEAGADAAELQGLKAEVQRVQKEFHQSTNTSEIGLVALQSRRYGLTPTQLAQLADHHASVPVHPAQLYGTINGLLICWLLTVLFYYRRRHGIVVGWYLILYSGSRIFLELIRQDNPLDVGGLTISQAISLCTLATGVLWLWVIHKRMPLVSPRVARYVIPEDEEAPARPKKAGG